MYAERFLRFLRRTLTACKDWVFGFHPEFRRRKQDIARLREQNARLREENAREIARLQEANARLREENARLRLEIARLRATQAGPLSGEEMAQARP